MEKRWKILKGDENKADTLHQSLKINKTLCNILIEREVDTYEKAKHYFRPQLIDLYDPWLMKDMDKAVRR